jgi:GNAT superfamily N-acetyltransferase
MSFELQRHALGDETSSACPVPLALVPMSPIEAGPIADALAAIDPWARYPVSSEQLSGYLTRDEPGAPRFAIRAGEQTVGAAGFRRDWLRGPYLQFLGLVPQAQGFGLGGLVMRWFEREARADGARNLWVCASDFNDGAISFYESHGFRHVADLTGLLVDDHAEVLMRKRLT